MLNHSEQKRDLGVVMHKSGRSTIQCAEAAKRANRELTRYDKEVSGQQGEKRHIKVL